MLIGVPREIKDHEYRVGVIPDGVRVLHASGHRVLVQTEAGAPVGFSDEAYAAVGAEIVPDGRAVYSADLVVKVKELQQPEFALLHAGQILFCYHHLAPEPAAQTAAGHRVR